MPTSSNRAKIIATVGPASRAPETLKALKHAGVNVFRLNMSHGEQDTHAENIASIKAVSEELGRATAILIDLQGPKLRTGKLKDDKLIELVKGQSVQLMASDEPSHNGTPTVIATPAKELVASLAVGEPIYVADGLLHLTVAERLDETTVVCNVEQGGMLAERKGINVPHTTLKFSPLTDKDKSDALFAVEQGAHYIALSFVRSARDIMDLRLHIINAGHTPPPIIAKIEKPQAIEELDDIINAADAIMIARGDLGVELPYAQVPVIQKDIIEKANAASKPVIVATQMLESMMTSTYPNRAEVSDIANAVIDGADAVMLSGETAMGEHPVKAVETMREIIVTAEQHFQAHFEADHIRPHQTSDIHTPPHQTIAHAASYAAIKADVRAMVVLSDSGRMALRVSKLKSPRPIVALTEEDTIFHQMSLMWGVFPLKIRYADTTEIMLNRTEELLLEKGLLEIGDLICYCAGETPVLGSSNMIKLITLGEAVKSAAGLLRHT